MLFTDRVRRVRSVRGGRVAEGEFEAEQQQGGRRARQQFAEGMHTRAHTRT